MRKKLVLTDVERLILANQYEILSKLEKMDGGPDAEEYEQTAEQLRDGHAFLYDGFLNSVLSDKLSEGIEQHVLETLELLSTLKSSYQNLPESERQDIDEHDVTFHGFDGNNETEMLLFAEALAKAGRFSSTLKRNALNSHCPTYELYARMLRKWKELGEPLYPLSAEHIRQIVAERIHPENR
ncbi:YfbU family protein [Paludibacterium sp. B53371]|uniref:YfbU family protein n=1 Tax=Paludibacterium sp. B53371 TaxID=2806263 RepID=UPI001C05BC8B|nr:YfbU family protein [Paludibacterium sp. B53371]